MRVAVKEAEGRQELIQKTSHALSLLWAPAVDDLLSESPTTKKLRFDGKQLQV